MRYVIILMMMVLTNVTYVEANQGTIIPDINNTITINFEDKSIKYPENRPEIGDIFFITIKNIDLGKYDIIINKTDTIISKQIDISAIKSFELAESINGDDTIKKVKKDAPDFYTSLPLQFRDEYSDIKIVINPRNDELFLSSYETKILFPQPSTSYWSLGFSFYRASISTTEYNIRESKVDTVSQYQIIEENPLENEYGTAALIKYGGIIVEDISLGLHGTFGVGMSLNENVKPRLLVGGGFSIGRAHKFTADIGFIGGYTRTLSNAYSIDEQMLVKPENIYQVEFNNSVFIAFGYTFTL